MEILVLLFVSTIFSIFVLFRLLYFFSEMIIKSNRIRYIMFYLCLMLVFIIMSNLVIFKYYYELSQTLN